MKTIYLPLIYTRPTYGMTLDSLMMMELPPGYQLYWDRIYNMPIDHAREVAGQKCIKEGCDYMLMFDNDATWHPGALARMLEHDLPVVCASMYVRSFPPTPTIGKFRNKDGRYTYYEYTSTMDIIEALIKRFELQPDGLNTLLLDRYENDLVEVDGCGMHFTLIKREVLEKTPQPWFVAGGEGAGEDYHFCRQAQAAGFKIWWDSGIHTGHVIGEERETGIRDLIYFLATIDKEIYAGQRDNMVLVVKSE